MSIIQEFRTHLRTLSPGAKWLKADFHLHCPESHDYRYKGSDKYKLLGEELNRLDYSFACILRHQTFPSAESIARIQEYAPNTLLIPAAELNVFVDALNLKVGRESYFHLIVAMSPDRIDEGPGLLANAERELKTEGDGSYPSGFRSHIEDVADFFRAQDMIVIPAHLHSKNNVEKSRSIDDIYEDSVFLKIVKDGVFDALEVTDVKTARFFSGGMTTKDGVEIPKMSCVRSSDAHRFDELTQRSRYTWIKSETNTFQELRAALRIPHRVSLVEQSLEHAWIEGIHVKGNFLQDEWLRLNPEMNCFIGAKGSGKTSFLECIRFVLGTRIPDERREQVDKHLDRILGSSGSVELAVRAADGTPFLLVRRADSKERLTLIDQNDSVSEVAPGQQAPFAAAILGWHEIESVADHPEQRVRLVDSLRKDGSVLDSMSTIEKTIETARDELPILQRDLKRLKQEFDAWAELDRKRATLEHLQNNAIVELQNKYDQWSSAEASITAIVSQLQDRRVQIVEDYNRRLDIDFEAMPTLDVSPELQVQYDRTVAEFAGRLDAQIFSFNDASDSLAVQLQKLLGTIKETFLHFRTVEYTSALASLSDSEREILSSRIQVIEETKSIRILRERAEAIQTSVQASAKRFASYCRTIVQVRKQISDLRREVCESFSRSSENVTLELKPGSNRRKWEWFRNTYGQDAEAQEVLKEYSQSVDTYERLASQFEGLSEMNVFDAGSRLGKLSLMNPKLFEFLSVLDDDDASIKLRIGDAGYREISSLSAGQRCTAVFPILLKIDEGPLVIDQPEDNLDNRFIANTTAPELLIGKSKRQFLMTSHNANLVVLTDSDLIVHMDSDGQHGWVERSGFLSCSSSPIKDSVLDVLDGGRAALEARRQKYGE